MMRILNIFYAIIVVFYLSSSVSAQQKISQQIKPATELYDEPHRPQLHFSPVAHWMNDPNGMVYYKGIYHLFYQYYPEATVWGPMHWGHATSDDLVHWKHLPVALYPDSIGYVFSGSAVIDSTNSSGFGKNGKVPMVAIFTVHDPKGEKFGTNNYQNQGIAYSLDNGATFTKYSGNPVIKNPGLTDFRDPKVFWYAMDKKWIMTLATKSCVTFYSSPNLKDWTKQSEFGKNSGAHGGVWECPDLFQLNLGGKSYWVLIVNLNPGGPNGGSGTQYFIGQFDGKNFIALTKETCWLDYGPDEYAGVTWSNTGRRKVFLGWMSNWLYANLVPTVKWRNAMTVPRELSLKSVNDKIMLTSAPVKELTSLIGNPTGKNQVVIHNKMDLTRNLLQQKGKYKLTLNSVQIRQYAITLSNSLGEKLTVGYDSKANEYYIDRLHSGDASFSKAFARVFKAPRLTTDPVHDLILIIDEASVELFADHGLTAMTAIFFPKTPFTHIEIQSEAGFKLAHFTVAAMKSIWNH